MSGLFGGSKKQVSSNAPVISSLRVTTALAGKCIPLVYGRTRISPNVIEYVDFDTISHTSSSSSGGKGGGSSNNGTTSYTYQAAVELAICQGPINAVTAVWQDKQVWAGIESTGTVTATQGYIVNYNGSSTVLTVANSAAFVADGGIVVSGQGVGGGGEGNTDNQWLNYTLVAGTDYTVAAGVYTLSAAFCALYPGCTIAVTYSYTTTAYISSALSNIGLALINGGIGQPAWSYMTSMHPAVALGYSGIAMAVGSAYQLDSQGSIPNTSYEVDTHWGYNALVRDANPKDILYDLLTNPFYGAYYPSARIGDLSNWSAYCIASLFFLSPAWTDQKSLSDIVTQLMALTNSNCFFSEKKFKVVPYGDLTVTGIYGTWTPNLTAIYSLTDDSYLPFGGSSASGTLSGDGDGSDGPVQMQRKSPAERYNSMYLTFYDRAGQYNKNSIPCTDKANIDQFGVQAAPEFEAYEICDANVARNVGQAMVQRMVYINNTYQFTLPFSYALLEPMDLLSITDTVLGLYSLLVRITEIDEDDGLNLTVTAEEVPIGTASSILYAAKSSTGYVVNYNAPPANVQAPVFFEPPVALAGNTGLAVCVAVTGQATDANWGGCDVWVSSDGTTYAKLSTVHAGARYGTLGTAMAAGATDANFVGAGTTQQILPGTTQDAANKSTLLWIGSASGGGEFCSYVGATLTGAYQYDLGGLVHGQYDSSNQAHPLGANIVRFDDTVIQSTPLDLSQIGSLLYFKFTSFNQYGGGEQSIGSVPAYTYTVTGAQVLLPPTNVASIAATSENFGVQLSWPLVPDDDIAYYRLRVGPSGGTWAAGTPLVGSAAQGTHISGDNFFWSPQLAGTYKIMVKAVTEFGVESATEASTVYTVAVPAPASGTAGFSGANYVLTWNGTEGNFLIEGFNVYTGSYPGGTKIAANVQSNQFTAAAVWSGVKKFFVTSIDAAGNESPAALELDLTVVNPGTPTSFVTQVTDNNVLFFWSAPLTGSLPIASYKLTKGATFSTSATIGLLSGADSFQPWSETSSGTYSYWLQATDTAGNVCATPANLTANVAAPPNFVLQSDTHTNFDGALVNMYMNGPIPTPVDNNTANTGNGIAVASNVCTNISATGNYLAKIKSSKETGKWYFEWHLTTAASAVKVGICQANSPVTTLSADTSSYSYNQAGTITNGGTSLQTGLATFAAGDVIGAVMNLDAHTLQFYKNGTAIGTAVTIASLTPWYAAISLPSAGDSADGYFGERAMSYPQAAPVVNGVLENGFLYGPVNATETWLQHGTNNSWTTPNAQVTAGDTLYFQPNQTSGSYEEVVDYGLTVASSLIQMSWTIGGNSIGIVSVTPKISVSNTSDTGPWTDYAGVSSQFATAFRWVKYHLDFACAAGANLIELIDIEYKLSLKQKDDSGSGTGLSTDSGGTSIPFNISFYDVTSIVITPVGSGTTPVSWQVVSGVNTPNPTSFYIEFFNSMTGARVTQAFTWQARGV